MRNSPRPEFALSVRAPWWWYILRGGKNIENRDWSTSFRGPVMIHASKWWREREMEEIVQSLKDDGHPGIYGVRQCGGDIRKSGSFPRPWWVRDTPKQLYALDGEAGHPDQPQGTAAGIYGKEGVVSESLYSNVTDYEARSRSIRQKRVACWCAEAFGTGHARSVPQRGIRLLEEAAEAAQAAGCDLAMAHRLLDHVWSRPAGNLTQELGGVGVTVLALAEAADLDADAAELAEVSRVLGKPLAHFAKRNQAKNDAGFNVIASMEAVSE